MPYGNLVSQACCLEQPAWERVEGVGGLTSRHPELGLLAGTLAPATALCILKWAVPGNAAFKITLAC